MINAHGGQTSDIKMGTMHDGYSGTCDLYRVSFLSKHSHSNEKHSPHIVNGVCWQPWHNWLWGKLFVWTSRGLTWTKEWWWRMWLWNVVAQEHSPEGYLILNAQWRVLLGGNWGLGYRGRRQEEDSQEESCYPTNQSGKNSLMRSTESYWTISLQVREQVLSPNTWDFYLAIW